MKKVTTWQLGRRSQKEKKGTPSEAPTILSNFNSFSESADYCYQNIPWRDFSSNAP
jgi:hypothetical protein